MYDQSKECNAEMPHLENLNTLCRACGNKLGIQYKNKEHHARLLTAALNINIQNDVDGIHPQFVCHACNRRLEWWQKRKNKKKITTPLDITVPVFEAHDNNCKICCSDTLVNSPGPDLSEIVQSACLKHNLIFAERNKVMYCMEIEFEKRNIIKSLAIKSHGEWTLHVINHEIELNIFQGYERIGVNIDMFLEKLQKYYICNGNSDFMDVVKCGETLLKSRSGETVAVVESMTIRHVQCKILSMEERCDVCNMYRPTLFSRRNASKKEDMAPATSHKRNDQRSREEIEEKLKFVVNAKQILKRKNQVLEDKIASMFQNKSRKLNAEDNNLMQSLIEDEERYTHLLPEGSPQRLLWEEQVKAAKAKSKTAVRWHPAIIRFCIAVYHKSAAAYDTIRRSGFLNLPHQNTIKRYVHYTTADAGLNLDIIKRIVQKANFALGEHRRLVTLAFDEMKIKSGLALSGSSGKLAGLIDLGTTNNEVLRFEQQCKEEKEPGLATHMLVIMIRGICSNICEPLCYFPGQGASGNQLVPIISSVINAVELQGFRVKAMVADGASCNRKLFKILSCSSGQHYMEHPLVEERKIYFFSDVPHLLKTVRNNWENSGWNRKSRYLKVKGQPVLWEHLNQLYEWDLGVGRDAPGLRMLHKLSHEHLHLSPALRMRVYLAAQVLSDTVANAFAIQGKPETKSTEYFVRTMNKFFDCLNVSNTVTWKTKNKPDLKPYSTITDPRFEWLTETFLGFLKEWEDDVKTTKGLSKEEKKRLCLSSQTVEGLRLTVDSFVDLTKELLVNNDAKYILSEKFSQDPLEEYFSKQRSAGGTNDNPTVEEFKNNFLSLHVAGDCVSAARRGNCTSTLRKQGNSMLSDEPLPKKARISQDKI